MSIKVRVLPDDFPLNPREEFDPVTTIVAWHRRYNLTDPDPEARALADSDPADWPDLYAADFAILLPLYMYDHSGLAFSTAPFSCPWDSGQVGFIGILKSRLAQHGLLDPSQSRLVEILERELCEFESYCNGEVFRVEVTRGDEAPDVVGGFCGDRMAEDIAHYVADYTGGDYSRALALVEQALEAMA